jgi:hypothetical protein
MIVFGICMVASVLPKALKVVKNAWNGREEALISEIREKDAKIERLSKIIQAYDAILAEAISRGQRAAAENSELWRVLEEAGLA